MDKYIEHLETLTYYDGIQIFRGGDIYYTHYIGVAIDEADTGTIFMVVKVDPCDYDKMIPGLMCFREMIVKRPDTAWWISEPVENWEKQFFIVEQEGNVIPEKYLPEPDFELKKGGE